MRRRAVLCRIDRIIELASPAGYVPTPRAVQAGGYRTEVLVNMIGPEGGQTRVECTLEAIDELFPKQLPERDG